MISTQTRHKTPMFNVGLGFTTFLLNIEGLKFSLPLQWGIWVPLALDEATRSNFFLDILLKHWSILTFEIILPNFILVETEDYTFNIDLNYEKLPLFLQIVSINLSFFEQLSYIRNKYRIKKILNKKNIAKYTSTQFIPKSIQL